MNRSSISLTCWSAQSWPSTTCRNILQIWNRYRSALRASGGAGRSAGRGGSSGRTVTAVIGANALQQHYIADAVAEQETRPSEDVVVPISRKLSLIELNEKTCKWPIGDPLHDSFHFCGNDSGESGPYCTYHARLAFQPPAERRRNR